MLTLTICCCCSVSQLCRTLHERFPCPSLSTKVYSNSCSLSCWYHPFSLSSVIPFSSCLQFFPKSGIFIMSRHFPSGGPSIGASALASVLSINIQGWFTLGLTGLISLQSKGLPRVFSSNRVRSINSSVLSHFYCPVLTSMHDSWKNNSFDETDLCWQNNVSAF